jgi:hypothetical protein
MRRARAAMAIVFMALVGGSAGAKEMNGVFGLGAQRTLGGVQGFDVVYGIGKLMLNGTLDLYFHSPSSDGCVGASCPSSGLDFRLALGVLYPIIAGESAHLGVGGRLDVSAPKDGDTELAFELPARVEWFITPHLSVHGEVGIILLLAKENGSPLAPAGPLGSISSRPEGTLFTIFGTHLTGGGGFTVFFN